MIASPTIPTVRARCASEKSIPPTPSLPSSIPRPRNATSTGTPAFPATAAAATAASRIAPTTRISVPGSNLLGVWLKSRLDRDVHGAADEHALDLEPVVEHDEICGQADGRAGRGRARRARGPASRSRLRPPLRAARRARAGCAPPRSSSARCRRARRPARAPSPSCTSTSKLPKLYSPSATPAAVIASVTSASRPRGRAPGDARRLGREVDAVEDDRDDRRRRAPARRRRCPGRGAGTAASR